MKRNTVLILILVLAMTVGTALVISANVPAPPVNQQIGIPDSIFNNLIAGQPGMIPAPGECVPTPPGPGDVRSGPAVCSYNLQTCRGCHAFPAQSGVEDTTTPGFNDPTLPGDSVIPNRHHLLTQPPTNFSCLECHTFSSNPDGTVTIVVNRDCLQCHESSAEGTVHHLTANAQSGNCQACHGSLVNNRGDGHYIPSYAPSYVTPRPGANSGQGGTGATNPINGRKQGACDYCHGITSADNPVPGYSVDTASTIKVYQNDVTHHSTGFGADGTKCAWCHNFSAPAPIRTCENCHGPTSLHNIQTSSATPPAAIDPGNEDPGYGHIGSNADCNGCHGFTASATVDFGPATPSVSGISTGTVIAGQNKVLTITGSSFTSVSGGVVVTDFVTLSGNSGSITLQPSSITSNSMVVTIPGTLAPGNYDLRVANASKASNLKTLSVVPSAASISSIDVSGGQVTINGSGFGTSLGVVTVNNSSCGIKSWNASQIVANCQAVNSGDTVRVKALFGTASMMADSSTPPAACGYVYSEWSACQSTSTQTRTVISSSPDGCVGTPVVSQACTYVPPAPATCDYTYSAWSACQADGTQTRTVISKSPSGCVGTPVVSQECAYVPPAPATCTSFSYSAWSTCSNGSQTRTVISSSPAGCEGGSPVLSQTCTAPADNNPPVANAGSDKITKPYRSVRLDGSGSYDSDGTIVSYAWNFGDGSTGSGKIANHTFKKGTFTVTLTVTDNKGATAQDTAIVTSR